MPISLPKSKNAFQNFAATFKPDSRCVALSYPLSCVGSDLVRAVSGKGRRLSRTACGNTPSQHSGLNMHTRHAHRRQQELQHQQKQQKQEQQRSQRKKKRSTSVAKQRAVQVKRRRISCVERRRLRYNRTMAAERKQLERAYLAYFSQFRKQLRPFVAKEVLDSFERLREDEVTAATAAVVDVNGPPFRSQPDAIVGGTMRAYQLKSLEWLLSLHQQGLSFGHWHVR